MKNIIKNIINLKNRLVEDKISEYSAECAYFIILSFFPFIIFLITIIQYFNIDDDLINYAIPIFFPENIQDVINNIIMEAHSKTFGTVSVSLLFTVLSASRGFSALLNGLRKIYKIEDNYSSFYKKVESIFYMFMFTFSIILLLVLRIYGNKLYFLINNKFNYVGKIIAKILNFRPFIFLVGLFILFLLVYGFIFQNKVKVKKHLLGALYASISLYLSSYVLSLYVEIFDNFSKMYGSLTTIMLIMIWLYFCMYNVLIGAELNYLINK